MIDKITHIGAQVMSVLLYPLFMPTYGMILFCYAHSLHIGPLNSAWIGITIVGTLLLTCILPVTAIWVMMKRGEVTDLYIDDPSQRSMPYIYALMGFGFWCYLLIAILHCPLYLSFIALGATMAIGLVFIINHWWKISAHLIGMGGLVGGIITYCIGNGAIPTWGTLVVWMGLSLLLMYARLRLDAHTSAQVSAGWLMGLACTSIPYCIYHYAVL